MNVGRTDRRYMRVQAARPLKGRYKFATLLRVAGRMRNLGTIDPCKSPIVVSSKRGGRMCRDRDTALCMDSFNGFSRRPVGADRPGDAYGDHVIVRVRDLLPAY